MGGNPCRAGGNASGNAALPIAYAGAWAAMHPTRHRPAPLRLPQNSLRAPRGRVPRVQGGRVPPAQARRVVQVVVRALAGRRLAGCAGRAAVPGCCSVWRPASSCWW